jgi:glucans biosynthesis protein
MLAYIGVSVAGLAYAPATRAQTPQATISGRMGENQRFDPAVVIDIARQLSKKPYVAAPNDLPDVFANLNQ